MGGRGESRPKSGVTVEQLEEWESHGAVWRAIEVSDERAVVDLCSCTGEPMERVHSDAPELIEYVRTHSDQ
jgi:hypothetical protein